MNVWVLEFELAILFFVALVPILVIPFLALLLLICGLRKECAPLILPFLAVQVRAAETSMRR